MKKERKEYLEIIRGLKGDEEGRRNAADDPCRDQSSGVSRAGACGQPGGISCDQRE